MKPALLLIDLQRHFLDGPGLQPAAPALIAQAARLLEACRARGIAVFHVNTLVRPDGSDRMPHWVRSDTWACVEGTPGSLPPEALRPVGAERVFRKRFFSAFGNPDLQAALSRGGHDTLIVAGIHLHACVRSSVLDAYERGYEVWLADDAVATTDPAHGELTRRFLNGRAANCLGTGDILARIDSPIEVTRT